MSASDNIFEEGGPHRIRKTGPSEHTMEITIPEGEDGLLGRECPSERCSPAYFKVKPGTGLTGLAEMFCPYCRHKAPPEDFPSAGQLDYAKHIALREAQKGINKMLGRAFGLGPSGKKTLGGGLFSMSMEFKPAPLLIPFRPIEEELRRDVTCPHCRLDQSVFGLAIWCSDCGVDIFMSHVEHEFAGIKKMLGDIERRRKELGARVAGRDIENALEDAVSVFEAVLRTMLQRALGARGASQEQIDEASRRVGNKFQNVALAAEIYQREFGFDILDVLKVDEGVQFKATFEKRHPITHNLGIVDGKYLQKARSGELEGREVRVLENEIDDAIAFATQVLHGAHHRLFPKQDPGQQLVQP